MNHKQKKKSKDARESVKCWRRERDQKGPVMKGEKRENKEWENSLVEREWQDGGEVEGRKRKVVIGWLSSRLGVLVYHRRHD